MKEIKYNNLKNHVDFLCKITSDSIYERADVDIETTEHSFLSSIGITKPKVTIEKDVIICRCYGKKWFVLDTGQFTEGLGVEDLVRTIKAKRDLDKNG